MRSAALLLARDVTVSRPGLNGTSERVLQPITLGVDAGELVCVVGPSGSGKSTLLRLFNRMLEPQQGQVLMWGADIRSLAPPVLRSTIPLVTQKPYLFPGTVRDNLQASARLRRVALPDLEAPESLRLIEMCRVDPDWLDRDARKLSIGQQQRVCLARALFGPCQALLLDEPTSALDRPTADQMAKTFRRLTQETGLSILFVTHDLRLAELCADRVALMLEGTLVEVGPATRVLHEPKSAAAQQFLASSLAGGGDRP